MASRSLRPLLCDVRRFSSVPALAPPRVFLPIFCAVAQFIFDLLLRPMIVQHGVHVASTGRIWLAAEHTLVRRSHDRLRLFSRHRAVGGRWPGAALALSPIRAALPIVAIPPLVSLSGVVPAMVVMDVAARAFPVTGEVLAAVIVRGHPVGAFVRRPRPISVVPDVVAVFRVLVAFDPHVIRSGLRRDAVRAGRRRGRPNVEVERDLRLCGWRPCQ